MGWVAVVAQILVIWATNRLLVIWATNHPAGTALSHLDCRFVLGEAVLSGGPTALADQGGQAHRWS
jgi:hypothetical protein